MPVSLFLCLSFCMSGRLSSCSNLFLYDCQREKASLSHPTSLCCLCLSLAVVRPSVCPSICLRHFRRVHKMYACMSISSVACLCVLACMTVFKRLYVSVVAYVSSFAPAAVSVHGCQPKLRCSASTVAND